jgi:hypothetical protein
VEAIVREIPAVVYEISDLDQAFERTEAALHAMRFAVQRAEKTRAAANEKQESANKADSVACKAEDEAKQKQIEAARELKKTKDLFLESSRKGNPFSETWETHRSKRFGISRQQERTLLNLIETKEESFFDDA